MPIFPPFCLIFAIFCVVVSEVAGARGDGIVEDESSTSRALPGSQTANSESHHAGTNTPFQNSPIPGTVAMTTARSRLTQEADHILSTAQNAQSSSPSSSSTHNPHHEFRSRLPEISKILLSFQQRDLWSNEYNGLMTTPSHDSSEGEGERETASRPSHNSLQRTLQTEAVDQHHTSVDTVTTALELTQRTTLSRMADQQSVAEASTQPDNEVTQYTTVSGSEILLNSDAADTARSSSHHHAETTEPATQLTGMSSKLVVEPTQTSSPSQLTTQHITGQSGSTNQQSTNTAYLTSPWQQTMQNSSRSSAPTQQLITDTPSVETTSHARHTEASDLAMPPSPSVVNESTTSQHRMRHTAAPKFTARPRNDTIDIVQPTAVPEFAMRPRNDTINVTPPLHESEVTTARSGFENENSTRVVETQTSQSTMHLNTPLSSSTAKPQGFVEINNETDTYSSSESFIKTSVGTAFDATMPTTESNPSSSAAGLANIDTIEAAMQSNQNSSSENLIRTDENHDNDDNDDEETETTEQPVTDPSFSAFTLGNQSASSQEAVVATTNISMATSEVPRKDATEESVTMATVTMEAEANDHGSTEEPVLVTTEVTTTLYDLCSSSPCQNGGLCNQTDGNFTCECPVGFEGEFCSDNIDDCVLSPCDNGGQCIDQVNGYLCVCMSGWNGINCTYNIDECSSRDLNDCSENANCTDTEGSYHCTCHDGYSGDGKICAEIDECSSNPCMNGATCLNKLSRYECRCTMGWNGTHCEQDVDECSSGVAVCDAAAECTNLDGSYRCECHDGFRGDGYICTEIMLYPYQHSGARTLKGDDVFTEAIPFVEGFPFFGKFYTKFYVNMNGYISFDKPYQHSAPMKPFPVPAGQAILAPFWSDIDTTHGTGAVYYQSYSLSSSSEGRDLIAKVTRHIQAYFNVPDFNATYLFIATWHRVPPYPSKTYADIETALFQVAIATDRNLSYTVFNYDLGGMLWHSGNVEDRSVQVGYSDGGSNYLSVLESFTRDVYQMDEIIGNSTGKRGRLAFDLNVPGQHNPNIPCYDWYKNRPDLSEYIRASEPCPCSLQQARMDPRYEVMNRSFCAGSLFWKAGTRQQCCYDEFMLDDSTSTGLLTGTPRGGTIMVESMEDFRVKGFQECCQRSDYCHLYYSVFPSDDCSRYRPVASALSWGDPHLITLDNYKYTFNGMGEYTIVDVDNQFFVLQGRTEAAPSIGNRTTATVFSAFAAKQNGSETVQIQHIPGTEDVQISIDGTENKKLSEIEEYEMEKFTNVVLMQNQEKLQCIFSSGISVQITASYNMLTASVVLPESFHGRTSGLVGLWNGDMADDFLLPNGTVMYPESGSFSDQEIFTFGQMWQIEEAESLFTYGNGTNYTHYRNDDFQPLFFGSIDEMFEGIEDMKNASVDLCGENMACLFDIAATGNISMGEVTALAETTYNTEKEMRDNYPPIFSSALPSRLEMKTTKDYSMTLDASDMNGDPISFAVWSNFVPQDSIRGSEFSWTPELPVNLSTPIVLYFTASDGSGAAIYNPDVWICACQNGGNCTFGEGDNFEYRPTNPEGYYIADCDCANGWTGRFCQEDKDACLDYPCYQRVNCTDMPAGSAEEYQCGPCPDGMVGDGIKCFDDNECLSEPGTCNQTCINTLGSYYCECRQGFHLNEDKHSCDDIDECSHHGNRCARYARCVNLPGSFDCQCLPEYHGNGFVKCIEAVKYGATLVFPYLAYQDDFENQDSDEFKELAEIIEASLNKTYKALEGFIGSKVIKFEHGSVVSHSELAFDIDTNVDTSDVESALEDAIQCDGSTCYMNNEEIPGLEVDRHRSVAGDLDECVLGVDDCHPLSTICINLNGTFTCECRDGWRPYSLPKMCEDIDECAETLNCTAPNTVCVNKPGSFACNCQASHMGDPLSAEGCSNICNSNPCYNDGTCTAVENGFTCLCPSGYVGLTCTEEDPELKKLKWIAIVVGGIAGFLLVVLAITLLVVCCKRKKLDVPTPREEDVNELLWSSGYQPGLLRATLHDRDFEKLELEQQHANRRDPVIGERPGDVELRYQPIHYPTGIYSIDSTNNSTLDYTLENGAGPSRLGTEYF